MMRRDGGIIACFGIIIGGIKQIDRFGPHAGIPDRAAGNGEQDCERHERGDSEERSLPILPLDFRGFHRGGFVIRNDGMYVDRKYRD